MGQESAGIQGRTAWRTACQDACADAVVGLIVPLPPPSTYTPLCCHWWWSSFIEIHSHPLRWWLCSFLPSCCRGGFGIEGVWYVCRLISPFPPFHPILLRCLHLIPRRCCCGLFCRKFVVNVSNVLSKVVAVVVNITRLLLLSTSPPPSPPFLSLSSSLSIASSVNEFSPSCPYILSLYNIHASFLNFLILLRPYISSSSSSHHTILNRTCASNGTLYNRQFLFIILLLFPP